MMEINRKLKEKIARRMETMMKRGGDHEKVWKLRMRGEDREQGEVDEVEQQGGGDEDRTPESFEYPPWPALCISIDDNRAMSRADILSYQERNHLCCCMS